MIKTKGIYCALAMLLSTLIGTNFCLGQTRTDGQFIFKTWLFLEHKNNLNRHNTTFPIKDSILARTFFDNVEFKLDTLMVAGLTAPYRFYSIAYNKDNLPNISYKSYKDVQYINVLVNNCKGYIICVNDVTGESYRILGFKGNDFLILLKDIQAYLFTTYGDKLDDKAILKRIASDKIDFNCIYNGLMKSPKEWNKFPCLIPCGDVIVSIN